MQVLECQYKALEVIILNPLATRLCLTSGKKTKKREREKKKINQNQNHRDIVKMNEIFYHSKTSRKSLHFKKTPRQNHVPTVYKSASQRSISVHSAKLHNTSDFTGNVHLFLKEVKTPASIR